MGKTSLLRKLQDPSYKGEIDISTNGVNIETLNLPRPTTLFDRLNWKNEEDTGIQFNVWDFGGQAVFHSTHRFFLTSNAIYVILYDMSNRKTIDRVK